MWRIASERFSPIWTSGVFVENIQDTAWALCRICGGKKKADGNSTSNLVRHLRQHHKSVALKLGYVKKGDGDRRQSSSRKSKPSSSGVIRLSGLLDFDTSIWRVANERYSPIWTSGVFVENFQDKVWALCRICKGQLKFDKSSTSALVRHLKLQHKSVAVKLGYMKKGDKNDRLQSSSSKIGHTSGGKGGLCGQQVKISGFSLNENARKELDKYMAAWLIRSNRPVDAIHESGLEELISKLTRGQYSCPSRQVLRDQADSLAENAKMLVKESLKYAVPGTLSVIVDGRTSM